MTRIVLGATSMVLLALPIHSGLAQSRATTVLSEVTAASFVTDALVLVLDRMDGRVVLIDSAGRTVASQGRKGSGPGEYRIPERLFRANDSTFGVLDRPNGRLTWLRVRKDTVFVQQATRITPTTADACVIGRSLYLANTTPGSPYRVSAGSMDGVMHRHFAPPRAMEHPRVQDRVNRARIGCLEHLGLVVVADYLSPHVVAYDTLGNERWRTVLPQYRAVTITATGDDGIRMLRRYDGNHNTNRILPLASGRIAISLEIHWIGPERDTATLIGSSHEIDAATGRVLGFRDEKVRLLDTRGRLRLIAMEDPEPAVRIVR